MRAEIIQPMTEVSFESEVESSKNHPLEWLRASVMKLIAFWACAAWMVLQPMEMRGTSGFAP